MVSGYLYTSSREPLNKTGYHLPRSKLIRYGFPWYLTPL